MSLVRAFRFAMGSSTGFFNINPQFLCRSLHLCCIIQIWSFPFAAGRSWVLVCQMVFSIVGLSQYGFRIADPILRNPGRTDKTKERRASTLATWDPPKSEVSAEQASTIGNSFSFAKRIRTRESEAICARQVAQRFCFVFVPLFFWGGGYASCGYAPS